MFDKLGNQIFNKALAAAIGDNAFINMVAQIGTDRDKAKSATYLPTTRKSVEELNNVYRGDWVAQTVITMPTYDAMRANFYLSDVDPEQQKTINLAYKKLKINNILITAIALSRLHGWAYILVGEKGNAELQSELIIGPNSLSFFTVLRRDQCSAKQGGNLLSADQSAGSYNMPEFYEIGPYGNKQTIHHSRVIRIDAPDPIGGSDGMPLSILEQIYTTLIRLASVNANADSLVYEAKIDVIRTPNLLQNLRTGLSGVMGKMAEHYKSVGRLKSNNGMIVLDKDEEYQSKSYSFGGLPDLMREFSVQTAGATKIPYAKLFGQSPSGMNSTGDFDVRNYYDSILTMQENQLRDPIEQIINIICLSEGLAIDSLGLVFNSLWQVDEVTRSTIELNNANRDKIYWEMGVINESLVAQQLKDDGTYTVITDDYIKVLQSISGALDDDTL